MAKKRSKSKKNTPGIQFLFAIVDLIGAAILDIIIYNRRKKKRGKSRAKIDPYAAAGVAVGAGMIHNTEDLLEFGGVLGAMGAFDSNDARYIDTATYSKPCSTRYAWRLNCEDGSAYGIRPEDYETRDGYYKELHRHKYGSPQ